MFLTNSKGAVYIFLGHLVLILNFLDLPILVELRLQVLVVGMEELDEVCRLTDPRIAVQKLVAIFLQKLEAQQVPGGALLPLAATLHLFD